MIYLDNAATTLIKPRGVSNAVVKALSELSSPGRGGHGSAMKGAETAYKTRELIADLFNTEDPENVIFCMNATHALNIAIKDMIKPGKRVVISGYEHNSVTRPLYASGADIAVAASELFMPERAIEAFDRALSPDTCLAVINYTSNVFGYIMPVDILTGLCKERGIPCIIDASQAAGHMDIDFKALGADYLAMPGHKGLFGPQGTGVLICADRLKVKTLIEGGTGSNSRQIDMPDFLPDRLEAGTHNMPGIAGLYEGVKFVKQTKPSNILKHERKLLAYAVKSLSKISGVTVYAAYNPMDQSGVLSFNIDGMGSETVAEKLAKKCISVRAGLHCAPLAHQTAGTFETGTVRASFSVFNTIDEIAVFAAAVKEISDKRA